MLSQENAISSLFVFHSQTDYRVCEFGGDDCIKTPSVDDKTAHKYSSRLIERVGAAYEYLKDVCHLPEISPMPTKPPTPRKKVLRIGKLSSSSGSNLTISKLMDSHHDVKIKKIVFPWDIPWPHRPGFSFRTKILHKPPIQLFQH